MLALNDPLWTKLDDAHRDRDIPQLLARFSQAWDDEIAKSLLWDCLCHQGTCYGATYAAIPHLLEIAEPDGNRRERFEIALFAGFVVHCVLEHRRTGDEALPGLPETTEAWDRKLDCYRSLLASLEDRGRDISHYERNELLPRYGKILRAAPIGRADIVRIKAIRTEFLSALPRIGKMCEQALVEMSHDASGLVPLLGGVAAAEGHRDLAGLLFHEEASSLRCTHCGWGYRYLLFGNQMALYADEHPPSAKPAAIFADSALLRDHKEKAASRHDSLVVPAADTDALAPSLARLLLLAERAPAQRPAVLLRNFLGSFRCRQCGAIGPLCVT
ncbi:hypothetical protein CI1B_10990 [Bradyrhizobium ivorense]|uniref:Uncharacterized protein n=1 Tax=Bradyrhizobium ivorense TaxID=2511166 RepID=A0A508SYJ0_9BRAD|nr:hypothetical protein [Bradyrhizobium ivorense]VIO65988.1 hypothetical protein CI1B_10990 [Bradyrhizobium ivorense]